MTIIPTAPVLLPAPPDDYDPKEQRELRRILMDALKRGVQDTIPLTIRARITATSATTVTVRVAVADPFPQGTNSAQIAYSYVISTGAGTVDVASPQNVTPESTITEAAGTYVDFVVTRPAMNTGTGRITFTAGASERLQATDAVDIPAVDTTGTIYSQCLPKVTNVTATTIEITVTATATTGTPTVHLVAITGTATLNSGAAVGATGQASGSVWVFNRGPAMGGTGQVQFRATLAGTQTDDDFVTIPEIGQDTIYLAVRARVTSSNATTVVVRVAVADPYPQGANSVTIAYTETGVTGTTPSSGGTVTPVATITEAAGTYIDYTITRPAFSNGTGRVTFTATAANRVADSDSVDIPAQEKTSFGPTLSLKVTTTATNYEIVVTYTGTMTYKINGGTDNNGTGSPQTINVTRNPLMGKAIVYVFKATEDSQTVTETVVVLPEDPEDSPVTLTVGTCTATDAGATGPPYNRLVVNWSSTGMPTGTVYDVTYVTGATDGSDTSFSNSGTSATFNSVTFNGSPPARCIITITARKNGMAITSVTASKLITV
jgi:hypothetical protein